MSGAPELDPSVFVAPTAQIFGNVQIEAESSIWPNVIIRAECHHVRVGRYTNLQDFVMIHVGYQHAKRSAISVRSRIMPRSTAVGSRTTAWSASMPS